MLPPTEEGRSKSDSEHFHNLKLNRASSARPYVDGAMLAIRRVSTLVGVHRGLDAVLDI